MFIACPRTSLWLHRTFRNLVQPTYLVPLSPHARYASTTSAIKRGLRAEQTSGQRGIRSEADLPKLRRGRERTQRLDVNQNVLRERHNRSKNPHRWEGRGGRAKPGYREHDGNIRITDRNARDSTIKQKDTASPRSTKRFAGSSTSSDRTNRAAETPGPPPRTHFLAQGSRKFKQEQTLPDNTRQHKEDPGRKRPDAQPQKASRDGPPRSTKSDYAFAANKEAERPKFRKGISDDFSKKQLQKSAFVPELRQDKSARKNADAEERVERKQLTRLKKLMEPVKIKKFTSQDRDLSATFDTPVATPSRSPAKKIDRGLKSNEYDFRHDEQEGAPEDDTPMALPYTVAASTFLYGSNTVLAALSAKRRKLYKLYLHPRSFSREINISTIEKLAKEAKVLINRDVRLTLLDRMSDRRPHNGVVLEASKLPAPPVVGLRKPDLKLSNVPIDLARQSAEDLTVNGAPESLPSLPNSWRQPFVLMLDGIKDEGNMGNIIRTAHFYGVDAVAVATNTCASINSSIVAKASSGAIEAVQILALPSPSNFVYNCAMKKWKIYAAMAPPPGFASSKSGTTSPMAFMPSRDASRYITANSIGIDSPLAKHPCILMLGAEGEGLRENLKNRADHFVTIAQGERGVSTPGVGVDSINVGVAAGVLVESFLRRPEGAVNHAPQSDLGF